MDRKIIKKIELDIMDDFDRKYYDEILSILPSSDPELINNFKKEYERNLLNSWNYGKSTNEIQEIKWIEGVRWLR